MLRRILFIVSLVIVLVSLNWFNELLASDLDNLTVEQQKALLKKLRTPSADQANPDYWETPQIYQENELAAKDEARSENLTGHSDGRARDIENSKPVDPKRLPEFEELVPFGFELFGNDRENEIPIDIPSAQDYILGPGDNLIIYLWGRVEKEFNLTLDREGKIFMPQVGEVVGWGLTLEQFTEKVKRQLSKVYSDFDLTVSLGKIRSIRIFVAGEVRKPGAYTVSSLTSLFNALYLGGGPNARGSMRQIKLMRDGKAEAVADLYNLLLKGDNSSDVRLQNGDVIFVPVAGPQVAVRGEVKRTAVYELQGEEKALDLLQLAGNVTAEAHMDRVMLERISLDSEWEVLDLNLNVTEVEAEDNVLLLDGDRITVYSIFEAKTNIVSVFGQVKHTGYYERNDSTKISDLIKRAQLKPYDVFYERADLFRRYADCRREVIPINVARVLSGEAEDIRLQDRDSLYIYSIDQVEWKKHVYIEGEIKNPGEYPLYDKMSIKDLIFLAGSFARGASRHSIEIARIDSLGDVTIAHIDPSNSASEQIKLQEDDHVYVRQLPQWQQHRAVTIDGEVLYPGEYTLSGRGETLYQLLQRVGWFTDNAFPKGTVVERPTIQDGLNRLGVPRIIERSAPVKEDSLGQITRQHTVDFNGRDMNRLVIDMDKIIASRGGEADIVLEPGDKIFVPTIPSGISVIGAVGSNGTINYTERESVKYYIERAGNFTRQADKKETRLVRATGEVLSGGILGKRVEMGDVVVVPTRIEKDHNWMKTFTTALSAATGVLTSVYIISKL